MKCRKSAKSDLITACFDTLHFFSLFARTGREMLRARDKPPRSCVGEGVVKLMTDFQRTGPGLFHHFAKLTNFDVVKLSTCQVR
jgi:hypothetical protein